MSAEEGRCIPPAVRQEPGPSPSVEENEPKESPPPEGDAPDSGADALDGASDPTADPLTPSQAVEDSGVASPGDTIPPFDASLADAFSGGGANPEASTEASVHADASPSNPQLWQWERVPIRARDVAVGANGDVWIVGTEVRASGFSIHRLQGDIWQEVTSLGAEHIAVDGSGLPWIVQSDGRIMRGASEAAGVRWHEIPGCALDLAIGGGGSDVWMLDCDQRRTHVWNGSTSAWRPTDGYGEALSVGPDGTVWLAEAGERIFRYVAATRKWEYRHGTGGRDISISPRGTVYILSDDFVSGGWVAKILNEHEAWVPLNRGATGLRIAAGNDYLWLVDHAHQLYRLRPPM
jgi:hypothetical protein